jgi:thymidylate synthase
LPIWFPEDTGSSHGGRVPCTLGYHFIRRDNVLHVVYFIRSCDYLRHFRDDIYLAVRKVMWIIKELQEIGGHSDSWMKVKPGTFTMHITSLHIFENEYELVKRFKK